MSGLKTLLTLFFGIRIPVRPTAGSYPSVQWSDILCEASETMPVIRQQADGTGQAG
jgi:hypothetical protein